MTTYLHDLFRHIQAYHVPSPEIRLEDDGMIELCWLCAPTATISISVSDTRLIWASLVDGASAHGTCPHAAPWPGLDDALKALGTRSHYKEPHMSTLGSFFQKLGHLAPIILAFTPLAPIAPAVAAAIAEAEAIKGASGADKLAHVKQIARDAALAVNAAKGRQVVSVTGLDAAVDSAVATVVSVVNAVHVQPAA